MTPTKPPVSSQKRHRVIDTLCRIGFFLAIAALFFWMFHRYALSTALLIGAVLALVPHYTESLADVVHKLLSHTHASSNQPTPAPQISPRINQANPPRRNLKKANRLEWLKAFIDALLLFVLFFSFWFWYTQFPKYRHARPIECFFAAAVPPFFIWLVFQPIVRPLRRRIRSLQTPHTMKPCQRQFTCMLNRSTPISLLVTIELPHGDDFYFNKDRIFARIQHALLDYLFDEKTLPSSNAIHDTLEVDLAPFIREQGISVFHFSVSCAPPIASPQSQPHPPDEGPDIGS